MNFHSFAGQLYTVWFSIKVQYKIEIQLGLLKNFLWRLNTHTTQKRIQTPTISPICCWKHPPPPHSKKNKQWTCTWILCDAVLARCTHWTPKIESISHKVFPMQIYLENLIYFWIFISVSIEAVCIKCSHCSTTIERIYRCYEFGWDFRFD